MEHKSNNINNFIAICCLALFALSVYLLSEVHQATKTLNLLLEQVTTTQEVISSQQQLIEKSKEVIEEQDRVIEELTEKVDYLSTSKKVNKVYRTLTVSQATEIVELVKYYSELRGLDFELVMSIIATESSFRVNVRSPYGAMGLMQVVPRWHQEKIGNRDILDPRVNIEVGTLILEEYIVKTGGDIERALAMYNGARTPSKVVAYLSAIEKSKNLMGFGTERLVASI